jgi:MFS family permease
MTGQAAADIHLPRENPAIALIAAVGIAFGVTVLMVTVFNYVAQDIAHDLMLSPAQTAGALSVHLAVLIIALPLAGAIADKIGARWLILGSACTYGLALAAVSQVTTGPLLLYLAFAVAGIAGAGVSPISYNRVIVHRFYHNRGLALGVALSGTGLGGMVLPWIVRPVIAEEGWRMAFLVLAGCATAAGLLAGLLVGRERVGSAAPLDEAGATLREAIATPAFWQMGIAFSLLGIAIAGFMAHLTTIFADRGLTAASVPAFHTAIGATTIVGRIVGGALMDRIPARFVGAGAATLGALALAAFAGGADGAVALIFVGAAVGVCVGAESDVVSFLSSRFYGIRNFARIYALQGSIFMIGLASGPVLGAIVLSRFGAGLLLYLAAGLLLVSAVLIVMLQTPHRRNPV